MRKFIKLCLATVMICLLAASGVSFAQQTQNQQFQSGQPNTAQDPQRNLSNPPTANGGTRVDQNQLTPQPFPELTPEHKQYLDQLLDYWETNSSKIEVYRCEFQRWVYDQAFLNERDPQSRHLYARTVSTGLIRYVKPDKGMYETENVWKFSGLPKQQGDEPQYEKMDESWHEKWICDGQSIFEYKFNDKKLVERPLPPEMRGERIADGPLPFLFGAKAEEMKGRYWIRVITPEGAKGEYWLEAFPKRISEAQDMKKVEIILAEEDFLPKAITVYEVNHDVQKNMTRKSTFEFGKREYNWGNLQQAVENLKGNFLKPKTPLGWEKIVMPMGAAAEGEGEPADPRQAQIPRGNGNSSK